MHPTSRVKLNGFHFAGCIVLAASFAALSGSWPLFVLIAAGLVAARISTGDIRPAATIGRRR
ncbi:MAG: hypothetical protein ACRDD1_11805 [Planctomycetia bacterium]